MLLFGDKLNQDLSEKVAEKLGISCHYPDIHVFPDSEKRVRLLEKVVGEDVLIIKNFEPPVDSHILEFCFLIDAAKKAGADTVTGITPYLAYQRADHIFRSGEAVPLEIVVNCIQSSGLDSLIVIDPHTIKLPHFFTIPVHINSAMGVIADYIKKMPVDEETICIVSPDMGGIGRIKSLSEKLGGVSWAAVNKDRDYESGSTVATHHEGDVKEIAFIVDDMISSGGTIVPAADYLLEHGVREVYALATHPVFSGEAPSLLQNSKVKKVIVTNSMGVPQNKHFEKLEVLDISSLIVKNLQESLRS